MSKLLKLKKWLTVADAARHLSKSLGEEVSEAEVLRFALDGCLRLSVLFTGKACAYCGTVVTIKQDRLTVIKSFFPDTPGLVNISGDKALQHDEKVISIDGVWDLMMAGAVKDHVEREWQRLTGGPEVKGDAKGAMCLSQDNGSVCVLLMGDEEPAPWIDPPFDYVPASTLPKEARWVVRTAELKNFEKRFSSPDLRPLSQEQAAPGNTELRKRIEAVLDYARQGPKGLSKTKLAEHIVEQRKNQRFSESAVRQILGGRYPPMKQFNLDGLD